MKNGSSVLALLVAMLLVLPMAGLGWRRTGEIRTCTCR